MRRRPGVAKRLKALDGILNSSRPKSALEQAAIRRQMDDLEHGHERGLIWDEAEAARAVAFFPLLRQWQDPFAGLPLALEAWQEHCIIAPIFGWWMRVTREKGGTRRFRTAYIEVPRKTGKSAICSGIALQGLLADQTSGAQVYCAATSLKQAGEVFVGAANSIGPDIASLCKVYKKSIICPESGGTLQSIPGNAKKQDGYNASRIIVDELHAHAKRELWDVLTSSTGSRANPLTVAITTAGQTRHSICWALHKRTMDVLQGHSEDDDRFFGLITWAEDHLDWTDPAAWAMANPLLGVTVTEDSFAADCKDAQCDPEARSNFEQKRLNRWASGSALWIDIPHWDSLAAPAESLDGMECFGGLDLGWFDDFAAFAELYAEREPLERTDNIGPRNRIKRAYARVTCWAPEEGRRKDMLHESRFADWRRQGGLIVTPGHTGDIGPIFDHILRVRDQHQLRQVAVDPNNARTAIAMMEAEGIEVYPFWQSPKYYNEGIRELMKAIRDGRLHHDGSGLLSWMMSNVVLKRDAAGSVMPDKKNAIEKIDGAVALMMAWTQAMFAPMPQRSVYESRGLLVI